MYVCICHALNDKQVSKALDNGAHNPASIFRHHGCQVQCGKCVPVMREMVQDHRARQCACATEVTATVTTIPTRKPEPANADAYPFGIAAE